MAKKRNLIVCIILCLVTFGIYPLVLFVKVTNESNAVAKSDKTAGGILALVFSCLTGGIYLLYWAYKLGKKLEGNAIIYLVLQVFLGPVVVSLVAANALNKIADQSAAAQEIAA